MSKQRSTKVNFIKRNLDELPIPASGKRVDYYDEQVRGLLVRITSGGSKTFYVRRKISGISERILIGRYPDLTIEQARKKAALILAEIAQGNNPQETKREEKEEPTLQDVFNNYMEGHANIRCIRIKDMHSAFERYFSDWHNRKYSTIHRTDIQSRINHIHKHHGAGGANHAIILMKAAVNWNIRNGYISGDNPWSIVRQFKIRARERFLLPNEMKDFFAAVYNLSDPTMRDYVLLSLLTGARQANVLAMRWQDIDFDLGIWRIPLTKNGESHVVPLTVQALQILVERHANRKSDWVLPGKLPGSHLVEAKRAWQRVLTKAKITDLRMHDLRRTLGSYMAMNNQSLPIIGKALGHKSTQATQIYARLSYDPVRTAMEQAQSQMLTAAGITPKLAEVVPLPVNPEQPSESNG